MSWLLQASSSQHRLVQRLEQVAISRLQSLHYGARRQHRHSCNARAQGQIPDTSDSAIQELAQAERSERAKTPYNIVFVTSEASSILSFGLHPSSNHCISLPYSVL